jgi:hypothetical protein
VYLLKAVLCLLVLEYYKVYNLLFFFFFFFFFKIHVYLKNYQIGGATGLCMSVSLSLKSIKFQQIITLFF